MFDYLYNYVFPNVAVFFEYLIAFAELRPAAFLVALDNALATRSSTLFLETTNFWTGLNGLDNIYNAGITLNLSFFGNTLWGRALAVLIKPVLTLFFSPTANLPMWLALPISFAVYGLIVSLLRFLVNIFL